MTPAFRYLAPALLLTVGLFPLQSVSATEIGRKLRSTPTSQCRPVPPGFTVREFTWEHLFYGASWPDRPAHQTPLGSWSLRQGNPARGQPVAGVLITTPITLDAKPTHRLGWVNVQAVSAAGYGAPQNAKQATVTISPCRADVYAACQGSAASGARVYGPAASEAKCRFEPGSKLWITWHFSDPSPTPQLLPPNPLVNTCSSLNTSHGVLCDANFESR